MAVLLQRLHPLSNLENGGAGTAEKTPFFYTL